MAGFCLTPSHLSPWERVRQKTAIWQYCTQDCSRNGSVGASSSSTDISLCLYFSIGFCRTRSNEDKSRELPDGRNKLKFWINLILGAWKRISGLSSVFDHITIYFAFTMMDTYSKSCVWLNLHFWRTQFCDPFPRKDSSWLYLIHDKVCFDMHGVVESPHLTGEEGQGKSLWNVDELGLAQSRSMVTAAERGLLYLREFVYFVWKLERNITPESNCTATSQLNDACADLFTIFLMSPKIILQMTVKIRDWIWRNANLIIQRRLRWKYLKLVFLYI